MPHHRPPPPPPHHAPPPPQPKAGGVPEKGCVSVSDGSSIVCNWD